MDLITVTKTLTALAYPVGLLFSSALLSVLCRWLNRELLARAFKFNFWLVLLVSTNPMFANWLTRSLESQYPQQPLSQIAQHDAIVVLGGGLRIPLPPALHTQLSASSDRYWYAAQLYKEGKANTLLLSGGNVFQQKSDDGLALPGEAVYAAQLLADWGVPKSAIIIEGLSRTTEQNNTEIAEILADQQLESVILVTSAVHMPRAYQHFSDIALTVTPASADVLVRQVARPLVLKWLPSAAALQTTTKALHEYYGLFVFYVSRRLNALITGL